MTQWEREELARGYLGKTVRIIIDRPLGNVHPKHGDIVYPVYYGYLPGTVSGDGEELDAYLLGVDTPVESCTARIIGIIWRKNDVEDKLVAAPEGRSFSAAESMEAVRFQEQYFETEIETL